MKTIIKLAAIFLLFSLNLFAQNFYDEDSIEVYVIDSFIPPDNPDVFNLSFFTSEPAKSKVVFNEEHEYEISNELSEEHRIQINLKEAGFKTKIVTYIIFVEDSSGNVNQSERYEFELQEEVQIEGESNFLLLCLFGGTVFLVPSPVLVITEEDNYFSLTKEIPILSFRGSYNYPAGYISVEYSHIFDAPEKNFVRLGYKHFIEIPALEYISPGLNGFTNFQGFNGLSPEVSVGLFKIYNTFTLYTRYRYNFNPGESNTSFHEISLGLYSSFFSFYF